MLSAQADAYRRQAASERDLAEATGLSHVKERHLRSAEAYEELARRLEFVENRRGAGGREGPQPAVSANKEHV